MHSPVYLCNSRSYCKSGTCRCCKICSGIRSTSSRKRVWCEYRLFFRRHAPRCRQRQRLTCTWGPMISPTTASSACSVRRCLWKESKESNDRWSNLDVCSPLRIKKNDAKLGASIVRFIYLFDEFLHLTSEFFSYAPADTRIWVGPLTCHPYFFLRLITEKLLNATFRLNNYDVTRGNEFLSKLS